jgi:L-fuculose-phosphate aldolase
MEHETRRDLMKFSRWLSRLGFTPGTSGNLSVRLDSQRLLVTPTGMSKGMVKALDMVIVDLDGHLLEGSRNVTSEICMHLTVYRERKDINAVIHTHPPIATAFACSGMGFDEALCQEAVMTLGTVPLAPYATTGTDEVAASMAPYLPEYDAILLENHGAVCYGQTLLEAFMKTETLEHLAHIALIVHQLGSPRPLGLEKVRQLHDARTKYAQNVGLKTEPLIRIVD